MLTFKVNDDSGYVLNYELIPGLLPQTTLFIHGNVASTRWWHPVRDVWKSKTSSVNQGSMILVNYRGCGPSAAPKEQDVDMHIFAHDSISLIESLKLGPINLVGHSAGGLIAAIMLAKAPHLFKRAILLDPVGAKGVQFEPAMGVAFEQMKSDKELVAAVIGATIYQNDAQSEFFKQVIVEDAFHAVKTVGAGVIKALHQFDAASLCTQIKQKVLVLHGEHDLLLPEKDSRELAALIKDGSFRTVPGAGHCLNVENPEQFVSIADDFFA